jgi:hypothetical protein
VIKICIFPIKKFVDLRFRLEKERESEFGMLLKTPGGLTRLLKQMTGHMLRPREQQQQTQPKQSLSNENCIIIRLRLKSQTR